MTQKQIHELNDNDRDDIRSFYKSKSYFNKLTLDYTAEDYSKYSQSDQVLLLGIKTPQSYGIIFQNLFIHNFGLKKVKSGEHKGDFTNGTDHFEYKMSLLNSTNNSINLVQIRPKQNVNYIIQLFDMRCLKDVQVINFYLSNNQMAEELKKSGAAHGDKETAEERRIGIIVDSIEYDKWINNYSISEGDLKAQLGKV